MERWIRSVYFYVSCLYLFYGPGKLKENTGRYGAACVMICLADKSADFLDSDKEKKLLFLEY